MKISVKSLYKQLRVCVNKYVLSVSRETDNVGDSRAYCRSSTKTDGAATEKASSHKLVRWSGTATVVFDAVLNPVLCVTYDDEVIRQVKDQGLPGVQVYIIYIEYAEWLAFNKDNC